MSIIFCLFINTWTVSVHVLMIQKTYANARTVGFHNQFSLTPRCPGQRGVNDEGHRGLQLSAHAGKYRAGNSLKSNKRL